MSVIERERTTEVMPQVLDPRVERGAALLDEKMPGWADKINLEKFELDDCQRCVLGQVGLCVWGEDYHPTVDRLLGSVGTNALSDAHGFSVAICEDAEYQWARLEQDWRLAILSRQT